MRLALSLGWAVGLVMLWSGLQVGGSSWTRRLDPYLTGLDGRSSLPGDRVGMRGLVRRLAALFPAAPPSLSGRLAAAGSDASVERYRYEQAAWALMGAGAGALVAAWGAGTGAGVTGLAPATVAVGAVSGYVAREVALTRAIRARRRRVDADLPVALDLLTLSMMAGEAVPAALARVAEALPGEVGAAFRDRVADMRAGASTVDALERLPHHLPGIAVGRLVDSLCTGIERGAPLAETLRAQCDDLRDARRRELLESGGRKEILMLVPVVFLILPVVVAFALYPGLVALDLLVT